jgi:hypothetical protein
VYTNAFTSSAVDAFARNTDSGGLIQVPGRDGCVAASGTPNCTRGRALSGSSSVAVSADGKYVYTGAFSSNAVGIFKRTTRR